MAEHANGRVDGEGRLIQADARLSALQLAAGGKPGGILAVPALAHLASLAWAAKTPVVRSVIVAEDAHDLDLDVEAVPDEASVALHIAGWHRRPQRRPWLLLAPDDLPPQAGAADQAAFGWAVDAALDMTRWEGPGTVLPGMPLSAVFRLLEAPDGDMPILAAIAGRRSFAGQAASLRMDPASEYQLEGAPVSDSSGQFAGYAGVAQPAAALLAAPLAEPSAADDGEFATRLDAALRAPLARIAARADHIGAQVDGPLRRDYADYAGDIGAAARHLLALVDDLSDLQAIERPGFVIDAEPVDLADAARRAAGLLQVRAADRGVRIDRPATDERLMASGDFGRVLQILVNLVGNAIRYSPEGAHVWLRSEGENGFATVVVADQGRGIAPEDHARIFEKFGRVDPGEAEGSGLGLYISRQLARAMGGDITVDSAPGQGARFTLSLPAG